jgi:Zn-dependent M28 family amino/carboxypeptidase
MRLTLTFSGLLAATLACCLPAAGQLSPEPSDPLARIRDAAKTNVQACSATGETLCEEVAPKIIDNAMGESPLAENVRRLNDAIADHPSGGTEQRAVSWAVAAFHNAGVDVHAEKYTLLGTSTEHENVVAEIRGREKPDEWVLLGARLGPGESNDATIANNWNAASVIEAARDISRTGIRPRRSIRFVLFTGDERATSGSWGYVLAHRPDLNRARGAILLNPEANSVSGYLLMGRPDIEAGVRDATKQAQSLGVHLYLFDAPLGTDAFDFVIQGIPTLITYEPKKEYRFSPAKYFRHKRPETQHRDRRRHRVWNR